MDILTFQVFILKRVGFPDIFQIFNDNIFTNTEITVPACTYLSGNILKIFFFRLHPVGYPLIGIIVVARLISFEYVGPFSVKRFSQIFQKNFQRLVRGFLHQSNPKTFIYDGFQILNTLYAIMRLAAFNGWQIFADLFKKLS